MKPKNKYSVYTKWKMLCWLIRTKLICSKARLIRFPFDLRGRKFIDLGEKLTTGIGCRLEAFSEDGKITMKFGFGVQMNDYVHICAMKGVYIGNNVLIAGNIYISDNLHGYYTGGCDDTSPHIIPIMRSYRTSEVTIEDNVWIGEFVSILPGVTIGKGSIIGTMSVVTKSIPPYCIAVGSPAKPIKKYNFETQRWERINKNE